VAQVSNPSFQKPLAARTDANAAFPLKPNASQEHATIVLLLVFRQTKRRSAGCTISTSQVLLEILWHLKHGRRNLRMVGVCMSGCLCIGVCISVPEDVRLADRQ
jgi:hypothetical protein